MFIIIGGTSRIHQKAECIVYLDYLIQAMSTVNALKSGIGNIFEKIAPNDGTVSEVRQFILFAYETHQFVLIYMVLLIRCWATRASPSPT